MKVLFQNHSSLLVEHNGFYLLTDPWFDTPAFGSWLPTFPMYIHPAYLAALGNKLTILVSHGHDDHCDDKILEIFDKDTKFVTADFKSPSVMNRLKRLGFDDITPINSTENFIGGFHLSSYINENISHDDAIYLIRTNDGAVIHANDNWFKFNEEHEKILKQRIQEYPESDVLLFSQTNSASGYPLNYNNYSEHDKLKILIDKVKKMTLSGMENAKRLGLKKFFSYAGFASPHVKGHNYDTISILPTGKYLRDILTKDDICKSVFVEDFYPGDFVELPGGTIVKAFANSYSDSMIKSKSSIFHSKYGIIEKCLSFKNYEPRNPVNFQWVDDFLMEFEKFSIKRININDQQHKTIISKTFKLIIENEGQLIYSKTLQFGFGFIDDIEKPSKKCTIEWSIFQEILTGNALFEDAYTGYHGIWERHPENIYNRDIVMMIVMFSYVYKNRLANNYKERYFNYL